MLRPPPAPRRAPQLHAWPSPGNTMPPRLGGRPCEARGSQCHGRPTRSPPVTAQAGPQRRVLHRDHLMPLLLSAHAVTDTDRAVPVHAMPRTRISQRLPRRIGVSRRQHHRSRLRCPANPPPQDPGQPVPHPAATSAARAGRVIPGLPSVSKHGGRPGTERRDMPDGGGRSQLPQGTSQLITPQKVGAGRIFRARCAVGGKHMLSQRQSIIDRHHDDITPCSSVWLEVQGAVITYRWRNPPWSSGVDGDYVGLPVPLSNKQP